MLSTRALMQITDCRKPVDMSGWSDADLVNAVRCFGNSEPHCEWLAAQAQKEYERRHPCSFEPRDVDAILEGNEC